MSISKAYTDFRVGDLLVRGIRIKPHNRGEPYYINRFYIVSSVRRPLYQRKKDILSLKMLFSVSGGRLNYDTNESKEDWVTANYVNRFLIKTPKDIPSIYDSVFFVHSKGCQW